MPYSLAIETSSRVGSAALLNGDQILAERAFEHGLQHASELLPLIHALLTQHNVKPSDLAHILLSIGPGSFTGLRIGVTLAKTLAFALGTKIVSVPTVRVLAENAPPDATNLILILDAKRQQIFAARFRREGSAWIEEEPAHLDTLEAMLSRSPRPVHLLGESIPYHKQFIPPDADIFITPEPTWRPTALAVARVGLPLAHAGAFTNPDSLTPLYVRKPEAEEKWEQRQAK